MDQNTVQKTAENIAQKYLELHPRELSYGVTISSSEDDSMETYYKRLTEEEYNILKECSAIVKEEDTLLRDVLDSEGYIELLDKLVENYSVFHLDTLEGVDLENPLKFTRFSFQSLLEDGTLGPKGTVGVDLTDEEFKELLIQQLLHANRYSINMLVYQKPQLAQKIMKRLAYGSNENAADYDVNTKPFVADMSEIRSICETILNPFIDSLGLFDSEDEDTRRFALKHQIVPTDGEEIYSLYEENNMFHVCMRFEGTSVVFEQEGLRGDTFYGIDSFEVDASEIMKRFSLKEPEDIYPYLSEHFNNKNCLSQLKDIF